MWVVHTNWWQKFLQTNEVGGWKKLLQSHKMPFVGDGQILDAVFVVNKAIDSHICNGVLGVICKLHIEKVYNQLRFLTS